MSRYYEHDHNIINQVRSEEVRLEEVATCCEQSQQRSV